jgi:hypothetical protein
LVCKHKVDSGSGFGGRPLDTGWVKSQDFNPGRTTRIIFSEAFFGVKILQFFDADPGWKKVGSGINNLNVPDPQHSC